MMQNLEPWQVPDMLAGLPSQFGQPGSNFNGTGFSKYFQNMDLADTENMKEDASNEAEASAAAFSVPEENPPANLGIYAFPVKRVNFANIFTQFTIQVFNVPRNCDLDSGMVEAVATCPSGAPTICNIRMEKLRDSSETMQSFEGFFKATDETGLYKLRVRLVLPLAVCGGASGVVADVAYVQVTRNYYRDGYKLTSHAYQLQFERPGPEDSATTNVWGLACDKMTNRVSMKWF